MNSKADAVVRGLYDRVWPLCFDGVLDAAKASLEVEISEEDSFYSHKRNSIYIRLAERDLEHLESITVGDFFPKDLGDWESWHRCLVEEIAHEYQAKVLAGGFTDEGRRLHRLFWCRCEPPREHGSDFFTAVAHVAHCLHLEAEVVARQLTVQLPSHECPPPLEDVVQRSAVHVGES